MTLWVGLGRYIIGVFAFPGFSLIAHFFSHRFGRGIFIPYLYFRTLFTALCKIKIVN